MDDETQIIEPSEIDDPGLVRRVSPRTLVRVVADSQLAADLLELVPELGSGAVLIIEREGQSNG